MTFFIDRHKHWEVSKCRTTDIFFSYALKMRLDSHTRMTRFFFVLKPTDILFYSHNFRQNVQPFFCSHYDLGMTVFIDRHNHWEVPKCRTTDIFLSYTLRKFGWTRTRELHGGLFRQFVIKQFVIDYCSHPCWIINFAFSFPGSIATTRSKYPFATAFSPLK